MEESLYTLLNSALSFPVAWGTLGDGTGLPRATMHRTGAVQDMTMRGAGALDISVQIDCYGATYAEAITASRAVRAELDGYRGGDILLARLLTFDDSIEGDAQLLHRVRLTYSIWHRD